MVPVLRRYVGWVPEDHAIGRSADGDLTNYRCGLCLGWFRVLTLANVPERKEGDFRMSVLRRLAGPDVTVFGSVMHRLPCFR